MFNRPNSAPIPETKPQPDEDIVSSDYLPLSPQIKSRRLSDVKKAAKISIFINNKNFMAPTEQFNQNQEVKQEANPVQNSGVMSTLKKLCNC